MEAAAGFKVGAKRKIETSIFYSGFFWVNGVDVSSSGSTTRTGMCTGRGTRANVVSSNVSSKVSFELAP